MSQNKYTTASQVKAYPAVPSTVDNDFLDRLIDRASAYIDNRTGRKFGFAPGDTPNVNYLTATDEEYTVNNWGGFYLKHPDVQAISAVKVGANNTLYGADDYSFDQTTGRLEIGVAAYNDTVKMSYTYGYLGVPDDIAFACEAIVIAMYQSLGGKGAVNSVRTGNYQVSYNTSKITMPNTPPDAEAIIRQYRFVHI